MVVYSSREVRSDMDVALRMALSAKLCGERFKSYRASKFKSGVVRVKKIYFFSQIDILGRFSYAPVIFYAGSAPGY